MRQTAARQLAREIAGAQTICWNGTYRWGVLMPSGTFVTDISKVWEPPRSTVVRAFDQEDTVRELFIDKSHYGALYAITDSGAAVHINGVPWQLIVTG